MEIQCDRCDGVLERQGGLLFSPPNKGKVSKFHLCYRCYVEAVEHLFGW